jgi:hypothetical protein
MTCRCESTSSPVCSSSAPHKPSTMSEMEWEDFVTCRVLFRYYIKQEANEADAKCDEFGRTWGWMSGDLYTGPYGCLLDVYLVHVKYWSHSGWITIPLNYIEAMKYRLPHR